MHSPLPLNFNSANTRLSTSFERTHKDHPVSTFTVPRSQTPVDEPSSVPPLFTPYTRASTPSSTSSMSPPPTPPARSPMDINSLVHGPPSSALMATTASSYPPSTLPPKFSSHSSNVHAFVSSSSLPASPSIATLQLGSDSPNLPVRSFDSSNSQPTSRAPQKRLREREPSLSQSAFIPNSPTSTSMRLDPMLTSPSSGLELLGAAAAGGISPDYETRLLLDAASSSMTSGSSGDNSSVAKTEEGPASKKAKSWKYATGFRTGMTAERLTPLDAPTRPRKKQRTASASQTTGGTKGATAVASRRSGAAVSRRSTGADEDYDDDAEPMGEAATDLLREYEEDGDSKSVSKSEDDGVDELDQLVALNNTGSTPEMTEEERKAEEKRRRNTRAARLSRQRKQASVNALETAVTTLNATCQSTQEALDLSDFQRRCHVWELQNAERKLNLMHAKLVELMGAEGSKAFMENTKAMVDTMAEPKPRPMPVKIGPQSTSPSSPSSLLPSLVSATSPRNPSPLSKG